MEQTIKPVYDLKQRSYSFSINIIRLVGGIELKRNYQSLLDQLIRSATSIGANIVEGKAGSSKKDLIRFYQYSLKSANETIYWLNLIKDGLEINDEKINQLIQEATELSRIIAKSIITLKENLLNVKVV